MSIIKLSKRRRFTIVSNELLNNEKLTLRAKGLMCYLLSRPEAWEVNVKHLATTCKEGRDAIYKVIDELIDQGYITREQSKDKGKFTGFDYTVYELPVTDNPLPEKPDTENPLILNTDINKDGISKEPAKTVEQIIREKKIAFLASVIDWVKENQNKYPKKLFVDFSKYWIELNRAGKKMRFEQEQFFELGKRLSTWFGRMKDIEISKQWESENTLESLNVLLKKLL